MAPPTGTDVWVVRRKWPDAPHYEMLATVLGEDEHGVWVGAHRGSPIRLPDGTARTGDHRALWCLPRSDWFLLHVWDSHPEVDLYVDVCTPPAWSESRVSMIDLDFDVVVWNERKGGHIELVDEDEFELHRVELGYPESLIAEARRAATDVFSRVRAAEPPFDLKCAAPWLDALDSIAPGEPSEAG